MMKEQLCFGVDIGGTNTSIGLVNRQGDILIEEVIPTHREQDASSYLPRLFRKMEEMGKKFQEEYELSGIGIGAPNANYYRGTVENPPNLNWGKVVEVREIVGEHFGIPCALTNDANAAAIGEMTFGAAKGMKDFIVVTLGTGLGSGIVVNGQLAYGHDGFAGELGHTIVNVNGRQCGCGNKGCLETYVSATGIKRTIFKLLADYISDSELRNLSFEELDAKMITEAAVRGDKIALEAFEYTGRILGMKLAEAIAITSPEAIFLFGGLANARDLLFQPTLLHMEKFLLPIFKNKVKLQISGLQDKNAAVLGASALIWNELSS